MTLGPISGLHLGSRIGRPITRAKYLQAPPMVERSKDVLHVVVGDSPWRTAGIRYRRHHLAEYLSLCEATAAVYWVYPRWSTGNTLHREALSTNHVDIPVGPVPSGIREFGIPANHTSSLYAPISHRSLLIELTQQVRSHSACQKVLWFTIPIFAGVLDVVPWTKVVYDCSDYWTALWRRSSLKSGLVTLLRWRSEARIIRSSSDLFASSAHLADRLSKTFRRDAVLVENGVDVNAFRGAPRESGIEDQLPPPPRLVFVGPLKEQRINLALLHAVAIAAPNFNLILVGPAGDEVPAVDRLLSLPNVTWLGARRPEDIPGIMKLMDVGLIPYQPTGFNAGAFPLKFLEYMAAGLPVVGCGAPSIDQHTEDGVYINTDGTPETFLAACRTALTWAGASGRRIAIAHQHDWRAKLARMHDVVITDLAASVTISR